MADIADTTQDNVHHSKLSLPGIPRFAVGASLHAMGRLVGDAFKMAYAEPFGSARRHKQVTEDDDGRDPSW